MSFEDYCVGVIVINQGCYKVLKVLNGFFFFFFTLIIFTSCSSTKLYCLRHIFLKTKLIKKIYSKFSRKKMGQKLSFLMFVLKQKGKTEIKKFTKTWLLSLQKQKLLSFFLEKKKKNWR